MGVLQLIFKIEADPLIFSPSDQLKGLILRIMMPLGDFFEHCRHRGRGNTFKLLASMK